ncbi:kinesin-like protein KIF26A isoform X1 [Ischnura elegans]|uniref:kinesin-like protein KIF26A isoform X1 n=1 Tax=Ischnura elegans TaxID=197161 RepID=UPI001ED87AAA|nr:kinesin-like protein KIF26A isoform X1 [Ischnura elegans]
MLRVSGGPVPGGAVNGSGGGGTGSGAGGGGDASSSGAAGGTSSFFSIDKRRKQVTLFDPAACGGGSSAPEDRRVGVAAPKMFAFDAIFSQEDSQTEVCSSALTDVIHAVINGTDGCLFCFGHARLGKTYTMLGSSESASTLGVIPCAISWLFRGINEQKQKTGARFSVRVSAVEVTGPSDQLRDLLAGHANDSEQSPGVYLRDDPLFGTQLQNQSELRVPTAEKAAFYLDAAIAVRGRLGEEMNGGTGGQNCGTPRNDSHMLYTLHVYQYSVDKSGKGGVAGGRSRLHLIDLGSCERGKANGGIPLSGLGNVLLAIFNGQKHLPHRDSKVAQLLKECLSSLTCHAAMIAHVSPFAAHYTDTLATVQLASRIHRMRRRKIRFTGGSTGSGGSSGEETRAGVGGAGMGNFHPQDGSKSGSSDVDPSSSEQSADTVIYVGPSADDATDGEHPPVYLPSLNSGDNRCSMQKALRGSGAERRPSPSTGHRSSSASKAQQSVTKSKLTDGPSSTHSSPSRSIKTAKTAFINGRAGSPAILTSSGIPKSPQSSRQSKSKGAADISQSGVPPSGSPNANLPSGKMPVYNAAAAGQGAGSGKGSVSGASPLPGKHSDEHWIDGPRISRSRVAEARSLMLKEGHRKKETWVDGPQAGYGFMDSHKKNMIQRWVENQAVQIQKQQLKHHGRGVVNGSPAHNEIWEAGDAKDKKSRQYKELTVFKTCDDDNDGAAKNGGSGPADQKPPDEVETGKLNNLGEPNVMMADDLISEGSGSNERVPGYGSNEELEGAAAIERPGAEERREEEEDEDDGVGDIPPPLPLLHQHNKEISIDVSLDSFDVRLRILQERHGSSEIRNPGLGGEDVEIIEVEEPEELVPMQDSCLQVTEEDIALCMGEVENPLPEVDQESQEEHPLRILSQENLTVVSTFTDSLSVTADIERTLLSGMGDNFRQQLHHQQHIGPPSSDPTSSYNIFESARNGKVCDENLGNLNGGNNCSKADFYARKFDQLAKLHELCRSVAASGSKAREPLSASSNLPHLPSRCQSLSLSDMLYGPRTRLGEEEAGLGNGGEDYGGLCDGMQGGGGGSLYSEPVNHSGSPPLGKICDHCKMSLRRGVGVDDTDKQWQGLNDCEVQSEGGILNTCLQSKAKAAPIQNVAPVPASPKAEHKSPSHKAQTRTSNGTEFHRVSLAFRGFDRDSPRSSPTPPNQVSAPADSSMNNQRNNATSSPHKLLGSFSSLRHPDGASNPNLDKHSSAGMEFVEERRVPGNGQSTSDHEEEGCKVQSLRTGHKPKKTEHSKEQLKEIRRDEEERVNERKPSGERTVMGKSDDEDNAHHKWVQPPPITTPPMPQPLPIPAPIVKAPKLSRLFGSARKSSKAALKASVASLGSAIPVTEKQDKKSRKASGKVQTMLASSSSVLEGYDSGNDSGIVSASGAVAGITSGRVSAASVITTPVHSTKLDRAPHKGSLMKGDLAGAAGQCESSGYESVLRDSECSSFGSSQELDDRASGAVAAAGGRDAELEGDSFSGGMEMDFNACCDEVVGGSEACQCLPLLQYCQEDVERLERRWTEQEVIRWSQIRQLRAQQQELKKELAAAKQRLLIHPSRWSYELHVEASMDYRDPSFVEALEKETVILRKRVEACKSHVLIATCFDAIPPRTVT